jgi:hypothetical protein
VRAFIVKHPGAARAIPTTPATRCADR